MVEAIRYIVGGLIALFGMFVIISPFLVMFTKREGSYSLVPLIGPIAFIGGVAITPLPFSHWLWLAFLFDINTMANLIQAVTSLFSSPHSEDESPPSEDV